MYENSTSIIYKTWRGGWNSTAFIREELSCSWLLWPDGYNVLFCKPCHGWKNTSFMYTTSSGGWNKAAFIREKLPRSWLFWPNGHNVLWHRRFILGNASWMKNSTEFIHETLHTGDPFQIWDPLRPRIWKGLGFYASGFEDPSLEAKNLHTKKKKK